MFLLFMFRPLTHKILVVETFINCSCSYSLILFMGLEVQCVHVIMSIFFWCCFKVCVGSGVSLCEHHMKYHSFSLKNVTRV